MTTTTVAPPEISKAVRDEIDATLAEKITVADLLRAGAAHTRPQRDWGAGDQACALSAAAIAAEAVGLI
jgi:hypothetical protein